MPHSPLCSFVLNYFFALYLCCAFVYSGMWVTSLEEGCFFSSPQGAAFLLPSPLFVHILSLLLMVIGGLSSSLLASLSSSWECGCGGARRWTLRSLKAAKDTCSLATSQVRSVVLIDYCFVCCISFCAVLLFILCAGLLNPFKSWIYVRQEKREWQVPQGGLDGMDTKPGCIVTDSLIHPGIHSFLSFIHFDVQLCT